MVNYYVSAILIGILYFLSIVFTKTWLYIDVSVIIQTKIWGPLAIEGCLGNFWMRSKKEKCWPGFSEFFLRMVIFRPLESSRKKVAQHVASGFSGKSCSARPLVFFENLRSPPIFKNSHVRKYLHGAPKHWHLFSNASNQIITFFSMKIDYCFSNFDV